MKLERARKVLKSACILMCRVLLDGNRVAGEGHRHHLRVCEEEGRGERAGPSGRRRRVAQARRKPFACRNSYGTRPHPSLKGQNPPISSLWTHTHTLKRSAGYFPTPPAMLDRHNRNLFPRRGETWKTPSRCKLPFARSHARSGARRLLTEHAHDFRRARADGPVLKIEGAARGAEDGANTWHQGVPCTRHADASRWGARQRGLDPAKTRGWRRWRSLDASCPRPATLLSRHRG